MVIKTNLPLFIIVIFSGVVLTFSNQASDVENLLKFKKSLQNVGSQLSNWSSSIPPCKGNSIPNWQGIVCEGENIWGLKLEHMGLKGTINLDVLKEMSYLRTLNLINNSFDGPLPEMKKLGYMKAISLSDNNFQGDIPSNAFEDMQSLKELHLANNKLTGSIPNSLTTLGKLTKLSLQNNQFSGKIPVFTKDSLKVFNVSNNKLQGPIPFNLSSMDASSFSGNELCGAPIGECNSDSVLVRKLSTQTKILLAIVVVAATAAVGVVIVILLRRKRTVDLEKRIGVTSQNKKIDAFPNSFKNQEHDAMIPYGSQDNSKKLSFLRNDRVTFDMNDLLDSPAEMLDKGILGSTYKAGIFGKTTVVVKRYNKMHNVDKEEFRQHMRMLGRLNHINLIPLVAFYYEEGKLLVSDHIDNVSLAIYLHGNKSRGRLGLDWPTRLKIIRGVASGLMYLYDELPGLVVPHGHLKSSNVLLSPTSLEPILTDFGLIPLVNLEHAQENMIAYKSPEYIKTGRINKKTDIWSLGILMLETITGRSPSNILKQGRGNGRDIKTWIQAMVKDGKWTPEVFDKDMKGTEGCEEEIINILEIALICCDDDVDKRWDIKGVVTNLG